MAVSEPPGDFDYLWEDLGDTEDDFGFDDFDVEPYKPPPPPWYRSNTAMVAIGAIALAVIAILVSAVLLVSRDSRGPAPVVERPVATTPSSAAPTTPPMIASVPPSAPETPTPTETASAPVVVVAPTQAPRPTDPPEIGVTRTPVTRSQISVSPQPRQPHPGFPR